MIYSHFWTNIMDTWLGYVVHIFQYLNGKELVAICNNVVLSKWYQQVRRHVYINDQAFLCTYYYKLCYICVCVFFKHFQSTFLKKTLQSTWPCFLIADYVTSNRNFHHRDNAYHHLLLRELCYLFFGSENISNGKFHYYIYPNICIQPLVYILFLSRKKNHQCVYLGW